MKQNVIGNKLKGNIAQTNRLNDIAFVILPSHFPTA